MRMIRRKIHNTIIACAFLLWLIPAASMAETPLPVSLLTGEESVPVRIVLSEPEFKKVSPFDDARTEQLNRLARHFAIGAETDQDTGKTVIMIDQKEICSWLQRESGDVIQRIYSFDPSSIITEKQESDEDPYNDSFIFFLEQYLVRAGRDTEQLYNLFAKTPQTFADKARTEKTELRFSGFGKAVQRITISFPADYVQESFPKALADAAESEEMRKAISELTFSGNQKIGLLYDEDGKIVRITYDGKAGKTPETLRKVSLVWKCLREESHRKDSITLKMPAVTGADKDNIIMETDLDSTGLHSGCYQWDIQIDHRAGKEDRKQTHFSANLSETDSTIIGKAEYSVKRDGANPKIAVIPEIRKESNGEYNGTLEIRLQECGSVKWPDTSKIKADDEQNQTGPGTKDSGRDKPEDTMAGIILQKLFELLPEEDLLFFSKDIPDDMWRDLIH